MNQVGYNDNMEVRTENATSKAVVLIIATMAAFLTPFMESSVNIALPSIGKEFLTDAVSLSWVATSYLLAAAVFLLPAGRLADIYGRKRIFVYGISIYTVSSFLSQISTSTNMLISFRVVQGIGAAMIFGTGVAIITSVFPVGERGRALGINVAAVYAGLSLGPFIGGFLTEHFGWRSIFFLNIPLGLIVIGSIFWKLKGEWTEAKGEKFDIIGSFIYGLGLIAIMYGFSTMPAISGFLAILIGMSLLLTFTRWEIREKNPLLSVKLFTSNRVFAFSNLAALISYSAVFAVSFLLSLHLQYITGLDPQSAGLVLVCMPAMQAVFSPITGRLSDRIEPQVLASAGMALTSVGLLLLALINGKTTLEFLIGSLILLGIGFALFSSPNTNAVMSSVEGRIRGVASATLATMRLTGQMFSLGIAMLLLNIYVGRTQITIEDYPLFLNSLRAAFIVFAALCFAGIFASLARGRMR